MPIDRRAFRAGAALPERCAKLCFGGPDRNRLLMAATHSVYTLSVNTRGAGSC